MSLNYEKVVELCRERGMTVSGLAKELGLSSATATNWKRGASPRAETIVRIAEKLGCDPADLVDSSVPMTVRTMKDYERLKGVLNAVQQGRSTRDLDLDAVAREYSDSLLVGWGGGAQDEHYRRPDRASEAGLSADEEELLSAYRRLLMSKRHMVLSRAYECLEQQEAECQAPAPGGDQAEEGDARDSGV